MFVNRTQELKTLHSEYKRDSSSFSVIYGRRRVGKTTLIKEFIKDKQRIYYYAFTTMQPRLILLCNLNHLQKIS